MTFNEYWRLLYINTQMTERQAYACAREYWEKGLDVRTAIKHFNTTVNVSELKK